MKTKKIQNGLKKIKVKKELEIIYKGNKKDDQTRKKNLKFIKTRIKTKKENENSKTKTKNQKSI